MLEVDGEEHTHTYAKEEANEPPISYMEHSLRSTGVGTAEQQSYICTALADDQGGGHYSPIYHSSSSSISQTIAAKDANTATLLGPQTYLYFFFILLLFFNITFTFQPYSWDFLPSTSFWTSRGHRCRPFSPPVRAFIFLLRIGFSIPTARRFSSNVANPRSCAFR